MTIIIDDETGALLDATAEQLFMEYRDEFLTGFGGDTLVKSILRLAMVCGIHIAKGHYKDARIEFQLLEGGDK